MKGINSYLKKGISSSWVIFLILAICALLFCGGKEDVAAWKEPFFYTPKDLNILPNGKRVSEEGFIGLLFLRNLVGNGEVSKGSPLLDGGCEGSDGLIHKDEVYKGENSFIKFEVLDIDKLFDYDNLISAADQKTETATSTYTPTQSLTPNHTQTPTASKSPTQSTIEPSLTASATLTGTPSNTVTNTQLPTRTTFPSEVIPINTPTPSWTLSPSPTITFTATLTPTSTFESVPTILYTLKPIDTRTPTRTPSPSIMTIPSITPAGLGQYFNYLVETGEVVKIGWIIIVVAFWGIIAIGIFIYINTR
jgi:hypothetical protein